MNATTQTADKCFNPKNPRHHTSVLYEAVNNLDLPFQTRTDLCDLVRNAVVESWCRGHKEGIEIGLSATIR